MRTAPIVCPEESPLVRPQAHTHCPDWGLTRRLRREWWGCRPEGGVLSFEAKESTKESTRHGDSGKKASIAHFDGGARNVARIKESELSPTFVRAPVLTFFHRQNGRAFFPPLPIAALLPRRRRWADSNGGAWDAPMRLRWFSQRRKTGLFFCGWRYSYTNSTAWDTSKRLGYFCNKKSQRGLLSTLTFLCEP